MNKHFLYIISSVVFGGGILFLTGCTDNLSVAESVPVRTLTATTADEDVPGDLPEADAKGYWHYINSKADFYWVDGETLSCAIHSSEDWYELTSDASKVATITASRKQSESGEDKLRAVFSGTVTSDAEISAGDFIYYTNGTVSPSDPSSVTFTLPNNFSRKGLNADNLSPYMYIYGKSSIVSANSEEITSGGIAFKHIPSTFRFSLKNSTGADLNLTGLKIYVQDDAGRAKPVFPKAYKMTVNPSSEGVFTIEKDETAGNYSELSLDILTASTTYYTVAAGTTYEASLLFFPAVFNGEKLVIKVKYEGRQEYTTLKTVKLNSLTTKSGVIYRMSVDLVPAPEEEEDTWYNAWEKGEDIIIGGTAYNKNDCGDGILLSESSSKITSDGVYFVPEGVTATYAVSGSGSANGNGKLIVIGNSKNVRSDYKNSQVKYNVSADATTPYIVFYNLNFDATASQAFGPNTSTNNGTLDLLCIDNCNVTVIPNGYFIVNNSTTRQIKHILIANSKFLIPGESDTSSYLLSSAQTITYPKITLSNNIFWSPAGTYYRLINLGLDGKGTLSELIMKNNTLVNFIHKSTGNIFLIQANVISSADIQNNIFYCYPEFTFIKTVNVIRENTTDTSSYLPDPLTALNNYSFVKPGSDYRYTLSYRPITNVIESGKIEEIIPKNTDNPPFTSSWSLTEGYFPVDRSGIYATVGSSYDD